MKDGGGDENGKGKIDDSFTAEFELIDAVERQQQHPRTFELPDEWNRKHIQPGEWAKLMFKFPVNRYPAVERMWVRVTEVTLTGYAGVLDNDPENVEFVGGGQQEKGSVLVID